MSIVLADPDAPVAAGTDRPGRIGKRIIRERPSAVLGAAILLLFMVVALAGPWLQPYPVPEQVGPLYGPPSARHLLGLDDVGGDVVSLLIRGSRVSLLIGFAAMAVAMVVGASVGVASGYFGGRTDAVLMRVTDYFLVIPYLPLMIVIAAIWGPSLDHIILVIGLLQWRWTARIVRAQVKSIRERVYVRRALALGAGHGRTVMRHVLPQLGPLLVSLGILSVANAIFAETALAFLGLSDPTAISWGGMIHNAFQRAAISSGAWWAVVPPGVCVTLVIAGCYLLGQSIEESLNPRLRVAHVSGRRFRIRPTVADHPGPPAETQ